MFRTPPYSNCEIDNAVRVYVQLKRMSDSVISEPRVFTYLPEQTGKCFKMILC